MSASRSKPSTNSAMIWNIFHDSRDKVDDDVVNDSMDFCGAVELSFI